MKKIIAPGDPGFYINRGRYVEVETHVRVGVEGIYTGRAIKPGYGVVREFHMPAHNLLTNYGMNTLGGQPTNSFNFMHLGTGTTPPEFTDTSMANFGVSLSGRSNAGSGNSGLPDYFSFSRFRWTSTVGGATGNWTEIGCSRTSTNGNLQSRALIVDGSGNPIAFPVREDEQFQGEYEFRVYPMLVDAPANVQMSGTPYATVTRALDVTRNYAPPLQLNINMFGAGGANPFAQVYTGGLAAMTATAPLGSGLGPRTSIANTTYVNDSFQMDGSQRWGAGAGVGLIKTVQYKTDSGTYQIEFDTAINKLTTEEFIHNQRVSWARRSI